MGQQKQKCAATSAGLKSTGKGKVTVGSVWASKNYGFFEVIEYLGCNEIFVRFKKTGFVAKVNSGSIISGRVKDKLLPSVHGVGFVGDGKHKPSSGGIHTKPYIAWVGILQRCYSEKFKAKSPTYKDCTVCEEWHNFQNFAEWFYSNYPKDGRVLEIDKDLKSIGNKIYSPGKCLLVPQPVNTFIIDTGASRGNSMIGVSWHKSKGKFVSRCNNSIKNKVEHLGHFDNEIDAHLAWRKRKSELAYELAMIQDKEEVKKALLNWKEALDNKLIHPY